MDETRAHTVVRAVKISVRCLVTGFGIASLMPNLMMGASGTDYAYLITYVLLSSSLCFILSGILANWSLLVAGIFAFAMAFVKVPQESHVRLIKMFFIPCIVLLVVSACWEYMHMRGYMSVSSTQNGMDGGESEIPLVGFQHVEQHEQDHSFSAIHE